MRALLLPAVLLLIATLPAGAQTSWLNPGIGDWYIAANWSVSVPSAADLATVDNGGVAIADRGSSSFISAPVADGLDVGLRPSPTMAPPFATGAVELVDVDLTLGADLNVGVVDTIGGLFHDAAGMLSSVAGGVADGDVRVSGQAAVGQVAAGPVGALATGTVNLSGSLSGNDSGDLLIGRVAEGGTADGTVGVNRNIGGFRRVTMGQTALQSSGDATGDLTVSGTVTADGSPLSSLAVGGQAGDGASSGSAQVGGGISGFILVSIGSGSTDGAAGASGIGQVDVLAGGITVTDGLQFNVGDTNGAGDLQGTANVVGNIDEYGSVQVGVVRGVAASGNATGQLDVSGGGLSGTGTDDLVIGRNGGSGSAGGTVGVDGDIGGFRRVNVGQTALQSSGNATGDLTVSGTVTADGSPLSSLAVGGQAGDGASSGSAQVGGGIRGFIFVSIGSGSTDGAPGASGIGQLDVLAGGITVTDGLQFNVGGTNGAGDLQGTANVVGSIDEYGSVQVGVVRGVAASGDATGQLDVSGGSISGTDTDDLVIGETGGSGTADGILQIRGGDLAGFLALVIGHTDSGSSGAASGLLGLELGTTTATTLSVGVPEGSGSAFGTVELDRALVDLSETLTLGSGSRLVLHLDGLARGIEYGALDASTALLDGALDVRFEFLPPDGVHQFDLVRAEGSATAISGDFDAGSVSIVGLPPTFTVTTAIIADVINGQPVEIYRLTVASEGALMEIPALGPTGLLGFALLLAVLGFLVLRRRTMSA